MLTCYKCRYWNATPQTEFGECRRYPPERINEGEILSRIFPPTNKDDWCGEYKAKESDVHCYLGDQLNAINPMP